MDLEVGAREEVAERLHELRCGEDRDDEQVGEERHEESAGGHAPDRLRVGSLDGLRLGGELRALLLALGGEASRGLRGALGLPHAKERDGGGEADERGGDVGEFDRDVRRADPLGNRERDARDESDGPRVPDAAAAVGEDEEEQRHEDGDDRRLVPDVGADLLVGDLRQVTRGDDRDGDGAERDGRRVGDEDDRRGAQRGEACGHEHDAGDGDRSAEPGEGLEQAAEAEGDEHGLDARVIAEDVEDGRQILEPAADDGDLVEHDRREDDPHDGEEAVDGALARGEEGELRGHPVRGDGDDERDGQTGEARLVGLPAQHAEREEDGEQGQRRDERGAPQRPEGREVRGVAHGSSAVSGGATQARGACTYWSDHLTNVEVNVIYVNALTISSVSMGGLCSRSRSASTTEVIGKSP